MSESSGPGCPDQGTCHHECINSDLCFRVRSCEPLSGVYVDNRWPRNVLLRALMATDARAFAAEQKLAQLTVELAESAPPTEPETRLRVNLQCDRCPHEIHGEHDWYGISPGESESYPYHCLGVWRPASPTEADASQRRTENREADRG